MQQSWPQAFQSAWAAQLKAFSEGGWREIQCTALQHSHIFQGCYKWNRGLQLQLGIGLQMNIASNLCHFPSPCLTSEDQKLFP